MKTLQQTLEEDYTIHELCIMVEESNAEFVDEDATIRKFIKDFFGDSDFFFTRMVILRSAILTRIVKEMPDEFRYHDS